MEIFQSDIFVFYSLIAVIIVQRLFELNFSARNENTLKNKYNARVVSPSENRKLKLFHSLWFIALIVEGAVLGRLINTNLLLISYGAILIAQTLRFLSIKELGEYWTVKIIKIPYQVQVNTGIFKIIKHPAYLAVVLEFIFIPLVFQCYITLILFSFVNLWVIKNRIDLENKLLKNTLTLKK